MNVVVPMIKKCLYLLMLCCVTITTTTAFAQPLKPGEWRTYTAMTNISDIVVTPDSQIVWVATDGGVYRVPMKSVNNANVIALRNTDGLMRNTISAIALGNQGELYIGDSSGGLNVYRTQTGKIENITDISSKTEFTHRQISKILVQDSLLYIATGYGLSIYNATHGFFAETITRFASLNEQDTLFDVAVASGNIYGVVSSAVVYASRNSPSLSAPFTWKAIKSPKGVALHSVVNFGGQIVVGSPRGLYVLSADTLKLLLDTNQISVARLLVKNDSLYILDNLNNGRIAVTKDLSNFLYEDLAKTSSQKSATALVIASDYSRVVGYSSGGISIESALVPVNGFSPDGPLTNEILAMNFSQQLGTLFTVYGSEGMASFAMADSKWSAFRANGSSLPSASYRGVFYDSVRSLVWLSAFGGGVVSLKLNPLSITRFGINEGLVGVALNDNFVVAGAGMLDNKSDFVVPVWAYNGRSLCKTSDAKTFTTTQLNPPDISYRPFGVVVQDLDNYYYVGTVNIQIPNPYGVIAVLPDGTTYPIPGGSGGILASQAVNAMVVDQDNGVWCGTTVGVEILSHSRDFNTGVLQFRSRKLPFLDQQVTHAITVDGIGNKWVGTEGGVFVVSADGTDSLAHFTRANSPLIDNNITSIAIDNATGEAYIGTAKGISRTSSIFKQGNGDYKKISIFPNPLIQQGDDVVTMTINGLVQGSTLKVFTTAGRLVSTIDATALGGSAQWNVRDENGKLLPSGVYVVSANAPTASESGQTKLVLVRK